MIYLYSEYIEKNQVDQNAQIMIENMILPSYLNKLYFVASKGGYVASIQMLSSNMLKLLL